mgnify:CR=1 FL=1
MKKIALLIAFTAGLQACALTLSMNPVPLEGQKEIYNSGVATVISKKKNTIVALRPASSSYDSTQRPEIIVSVFNRSDKEFNISPQNIKVLVDGKPTKVRTYEDLVAEVKRKQTIQTVAAILSGVADGINAENAGYTYHNGSTTVYGNRGYRTYSGSTYNSTAAQQARAAANARSQANLTSIQQNTEHSLSNLSNTILRKTTVMPNGWKGGYIVFENVEKSHEPHEITFLVEASGEVHEFTFNHNRI